MKFINRKKELNKLQELWQQNKSQLVVIYGKRRVGKTELIKQFIKDGKGIYYLADKRTHKEQLLEFARVVGNYFEDEFVSQKGFSNWLEAFSYLKSKSGEAKQGNTSVQKKLVIAIDEYPYLTETDHATSSIFQKIWDEYLKNTNIYLILCGSSMSMMESELLGYKAPLYGRLTGQLLIEPMDYEASKKFFPKKKFSEFLKYYSITGGMPAYMQTFSQYKTSLKAVENLCWSKQGLYFKEVIMALKQELRIPNNYFAILKAIAWGKTRISEIANNSGLKVQLVSKYLDTLERLQFVKREIPVTESKPHKSRKGIYAFTENFVKFWFQYVYAFSSDLEIGNIKQAKSRFEEFGNILEADACEQIAREHLFKQSDKLFEMDKVGRYWDKNTEIDGVGLNTETKQIVFMEAKWTGSKLNLRELNKLREKSKNVVWNVGKRQDFFALYSKSGFTRDLLKYAKDSKNILLVKQDKIV